MGVLQLILSLLESRDETGNQVQNVVEGFGVDFGAHLNQTFDDWLEEREGGFFTVLLEDLLDLLDLVFGLDEGELGFLADLHQTSTFSLQVEEETLSLLTS